MSDLNALVYPATFLRRHTVLRLSQVFDRLTVLLPAENLTIASTNDLAIDAIVPAPLGDRLQWFDRLIQDWNAWAREIGLGTGATAEALLRTWERDSSETIEEIMGSLCKKDHPDPLLNARILLRIAHEIDAEDERLDRELAIISKLEKDLLSTLQGKAESEHPPRDGVFPSIPPLNRPDLRVRAWNEIANRADLEGLLPVGERLEVKDLLDRAYEDLAPGDFPHDLVRVRLPLAPEVRPVDEPGIREDLVFLVSSIAIKGEEASEMAFELEKRLSDLSRIHGEGPELRLTVYPKKTFREVLSRAAGKPLEKASSQRCGFSFFLI